MHFCTHDASITAVMVGSYQSITVIGSFVYCRQAPSIVENVDAMDEIRLRQDILDVKTMGGIFIWKIPEVRRRYRERITVSLYSPPF